MSDSIYGVLPQLTTKYVDVIVANGDEFTGTISSSLPQMISGIKAVPGVEIHGTFAATAKWRGRIRVGLHMDAEIPAMTSSVTAYSGAVCTISSKIGKLVGHLGTGAQITAELSELRSSMTVISDNTAQVDSKLPRIQSLITITSDHLGSIDARLPTLISSVSGWNTIPGNISARLPKLKGSINAMIGASATLYCTLPRLQCEKLATGSYYGAVQAKLPRITSDINVLRETQTFTPLRYEKGVNR